MLPHLSELHGAATHLAVVAIPFYALLVVLRRLGRGERVLAPFEPWVLGAVVLGVAASGATGLLVWGQAQQELRGSSFRNGTAHFWLGIALGIVVLGEAALRVRALRSGGRVPELRVRAFGAGGLATAAIGVAVLALAMVSVQGYLGGRMTYEHGVGVEAGGQFSQTARGASALHLALEKGTPPVEAGGEAFSGDGLGCASCHGGLAQGARGPQLAGGKPLEDFRRVHEHGLFPPSVVTDKDFAAIVAFLKTKPRRGGSG